MLTDHRPIVPKGTPGTRSTLGRLPAILGLQFCDPPGLAGRGPFVVGVGQWRRRRGAESEATAPNRSGANFAIRDASLPKLIQYLESL